MALLSVEKDSSDSPLPFTVREPVLVGLGPTSAEKRPDGAFLARHPEENEPHMGRVSRLDLIVNDRESNLPSTGSTESQLKRTVRIVLGYR